MKGYEVKLNIRNLLDREGMSLVDLGRKTGTSYTTLLAHCHGRASRVDLETLGKLKRALQATWDDLLRID